MYMYFVMEWQLIENKELKFSTALETVDIGIMTGYLRRSKNKVWWRSKTYTYDS